MFTGNYYISNSVFFPIAVYQAFVNCKTSCLSTYVIFGAQHLNRFDFLCHFLNLFFELQN